MEGLWKWLVGAAVAATAATGGWLVYNINPVDSESTQVEETQPDGSKWTGDLIRDKLDPTKEQP